VNQGNSAVLSVRVHLVAVAALLGALVAFAGLPAFASAAPPPIVINSLGDEPQETPSATCDTGKPAGENCTLRAAIEAANFDPEFSLVEFSGSIFEGGQQIMLGEILPPIEHPLRMYSSLIPFGAYSGPAVGVTAPNGATAVLTVESDGVTIEQIAFGGGKAGIEVLNESTGFVSNANWFGLQVTAAAASIGTAGIILGPGSDGAEIGEGTESTRNVFTNAPYGIYVQGASQTEVRGNYIGVGPNGLATAALPNGVRIVDTSASPAEENTIGGLRTSTVGTAHCGGDCNVIAATNLGIDLHGETSKNLGSATGPTTISGNYIGLAADGAALSDPTVFAGIYAERPVGATTPGPSELTVGGSTPAEANVIDNGQFAMVAEGAEGLLVQGNQIGWLPASETSGSEPANAALVVADEGVSELPEVVGNTMYLSPSAVGIESFGPGALILGNTIYGGESGVFTADDDAGIGNQIAENLIVDPDLYGVLIENNANAVAGNAIFGAGRSGVILDRDEISNPWPTGNRIGGDSPYLENLIEESEESAISVGGEPETTNEVLGNFGFENGGPFIELREHSAGHPTNQEIKPPTLEAVYESTASGSAVPGAKVRLFGKPSSDPGSLEPMIGSAVADASGHWTATFTTKQPIGRLVGATQTTAAGTPNGATSEVSAPQAAAADPVVPVTPATVPAAGPAPAPAAPAKPTAPSATITKSPKKSSAETTAKFKFTANPAAGAKFECKLDNAKWAKCTSPKTYKKLKVGKHTFRVRAIAGGLTGAAVKYQFTVKA
jgi:CSLREA domain-containing protein